MLLLTGGSSSSTSSTNASEHGDDTADDDEGMRKPGRVQVCDKTKISLHYRMIGRNRSMSRSDVVALDLWPLLCGLSRRSLLHH